MSRRILPGDRRSACPSVDSFSIPCAVTIFIPSNKATVAYCLLPAVLFFHPSHTPPQNLHHSCTLFPPPSGPMLRWWGAVRLNHGLKRSTSLPIRPIQNAPQKQFGPASAAPFPRSPQPNAPNCRARCPSCIKNTRCCGYLLTHTINRANFPSAAPNCQPGPAEICEPRRLWGPHSESAVRCTFRHRFLRIPPSGSRSRLRSFCPLGFAGS